MIFSFYILVVLDSMDAVVSELKYIYLSMYCSNQVWTRQWYWQF